MKQCLIGGILTLTTACNFANATVTPSKAEYDTFYQTLQNSISGQLYKYSAMIAMIQKLPEQVNPLDPKFAQCMQSAIDQKFYEPTLKQNFDSYLQQVTLIDFKHDLAVSTQPNYQYDVQLLQNIFTLFAKGKTSQDNVPIARQNFKQQKKVNNLSPYLGKTYNLYSESYYDFFSDKSSLAITMGKQIQQCQKLQEVTP